MSTASTDERYFAGLLNVARGDRGLAPVRLEKTLNDSAEAHSNWMLDNDVFSHAGAGGSTATDRIRDAGFDLSGKWLTAENLAYVSIDNDGTLRDEIRTLHHNLMNSPGHRANILLAEADLIGIGLEVGTFTVDGVDYLVLMATQNFASTGGQVHLDRPTPVQNIISLKHADWVGHNDGQTIRQADDDGITRGTALGDNIQGVNRPDHVQAGGGDDWIVGRGGSDTLRGQAGDDRIFGQGGHDRLQGGTGRDALAGGAGQDTLAGQGGSDLLLGQDGRDRLYGGSGHDVLDGGRGRDLLVGGAGHDSFIFARAGGSDRIEGFQAGQDSLVLDPDLIDGSLARFLQDSVRPIKDGFRMDFGNGDRLDVTGHDLDLAHIADAVLFS